MKKLQTTNNEPPGLSDTTRMSETVASETGSTAVLYDVASPAPSPVPLVSVVRSGSEVYTLDFEDAVVASWFEEQYRDRIVAGITDMPEWELREIAHGSF